MLYVFKFIGKKSTTLEKGKELFWNTTGSFSFQAYRQLILYVTIHMEWGEGEGEIGQVQIGTFLYHMYKRGIKETNVLFIVLII